MPTIGGMCYEVSYSQSYIILIILCKVSNILFKNKVYESVRVSNLIDHLAARAADSNLDILDFQSLFF